MHFKKYLIVSLITSFLSINSHAESVNLEKYYHVVEKGDTLWDISEKILGDPFFWKRVYSNNSHIENPHLIYPNDIIYFEKNKHKNEFSINIIKTDIDNYTLKNNINTQNPINLIKEDYFIKFKSKNYITDIDFYHNNKRNVIILDSLIATKGDYIYSENLNSEYENYISVEKIIKLYKNDKLTSYLLMTSGKLELVSEHNGVFKLQVLDSEKGITKNNYIIPIKNLKEYNNFPELYEGNYEGKILIIEDGLNFTGKYGNVIIDMGKNEGVLNGSILSIFDKENIYEDIKIGEIIIYDTKKDFSYGMILNSEKMIKKNDKVFFDKKRNSK